MRKAFIYVLSLLLAATAVSSSSVLLRDQSSYAHAEETFNPSLLIADPPFIAKDSMSVAEIHAFLQSKNSVLTRVPSSDLGNGANGRSAAQIIWDAARSVLNDFGQQSERPLTVSLNPQVILVTLQKEQSLVTGQWYVPGSAQTNNALRAAMGMGCPDSGGCNPAYEGFTNQVVYGAAQLYLNYQRLIHNSPAANIYKVGTTHTFHNNPIYHPYCTTSTIQVTIGSAATGSLYGYTPHVCNGNANFFRYMNTWFTDIYVPFQPTLIKASNNPTVYVYHGSVRYPIDTAATFEAYGFNWGAIQDMTGEQASKPVGPWVKRLVAVNGTVYHVDSGRRQLITSPRVFDANGFDWGAISDLGPLVYEIPEGWPVHYITRQRNMGAVLLPTNFRAYVFPDPATFEAWGMRWNEIGVTASYVTNSAPQDKPVTRLMQHMNGGGFFFIDQGAKWVIPDLPTFFAWGFDSGKTTIVDNRIFTDLPNAPTLTRLVRGSGPTVYYIQNGQKRPIASPQAFNRNGFSWGDIRQVSDPVINSLPTGPTIN